ncbi:MAG: cytochrome c maturation protein CcmE [Wenzhouxiangellaceae bacterium]|nr:cytochrome c maturation protein CcmE [Wenzhouxiangellaceae bacterium]MBS3745591.1 cytochrome c maturation protein CcmE [Wenzhouxiangellaceae bacterium]
MTPTRKKRALIVAALVAGIGTATAVAVVSMNENMMFFISPSDVLNEELPPDRQFRLGGLVVDDSIKHADEGLQVQFSVSDGGHQVPVVFNGILPDLFREGQGIVAHGYMRNGRFEAHEVLAKHDENYMPPEVQKALDKTGHNSGAGQ